MDHLSEVYGLAGEDTVALTSALWKIARDMTEENLEEAMEGLEYEVEGTFFRRFGRTDHTDRVPGVAAKQYLFILCHAAAVLILWTFWKKEILLQLQIFVRCQSFHF